MKWIGLTGGIGTGKSTASEQLKRRGCVVVDADEIARHVVQPGTMGFAHVVQAFGPAVVTGDGQLDRTRLAEIIFNDSDLRRTLENILHPLIRDEAERRRAQLASAGELMAVYDVPLLFEKNMDALFSATVVVTCTPAQQRERLRGRNRWTEAEIDKRLSAQLPLDEKVKRATFVIVNSGTLENLNRAVNAFFDAQISGC